MRLVMAKNWSSPLMTSQSVLDAGSTRVGQQSAQHLSHAATLCR